MANKIKIGILGCGAVAYRWYLKGLFKENEKYSLNLVCDIDQEKAKKATNDFNIPNFCFNIKEMLDYGIDLAVVLTRHDDHFQHIKFFLENNINVYSEKPFAATVRQGNELINLAKKKGLVFGSAPQIMFSSRNKKVKKLLSENLIGKVAFVRSSCSNLGPAGRPDTDYDPVWFYNKGGSLLSLGIYGLSILIWWFGIPELVSSMQEISMPDREVLFGPAKGKKFKVTSPDNVVGMFRFPQNIVVLYDGSYSVSNSPKYEFEIHGTKGSLFIGGFGGSKSVIYKPIIGDYIMMGPDDDCHLKWNLSWAVEDTVEAILENREPEASAIFALKVIDVIERMLYSAKEERFVNNKEIF